MVALIVGTILLIITYVLYVFYFHAQFYPLVLLFLFPFFLPGTFFFSNGLFQLITYHLTSKRGEDCFGIIQHIALNSMDELEEGEIAADVFVYILSEKRTMMIRYILQDKKDSVKVGSFVKLKYYKGDLNLMGIVPSYDVPEAYLEYLSRHQNLNSSIEDEEIL